MRLTFLLMAALVAWPLSADPEPVPKEPLPPPVLLEHSLVETLPSEARRPVAFYCAVFGAGSGAVLAAWGLGTALADLNSSGGPPLGTTIAGLAWGTVLMAASGLALDYLVNGP